MTGGGIWAAVPVKTLSNAKQRLAPALSPVLRRGLMLAMVADVLDALTETSGLSGILVITADQDVLRAAARTGVTCVAQSGDIGHAAAADEAARLVATRFQADAIMMVPADVPLAKAADFSEVIAAHARPGCTIVPSWDDDGSNCLLLSPPCAMPFLFGPDSFRRHRRQAAQRDIKMRVLRNRNIGHDIDTKSDLDRLCGRLGGWHTHRFLLQSAVVPRPSPLPRLRAQP